MLYPTLNQPYVFFVILLAGLVSGFLFDLSNFLNIFFNRNKVTKQILYFLATISSAFLLVLCNILCNYGIFRIFIILTFLTAFILQRFTLGSLISIAISKVSKIKLPKLKLRKTKTASSETIQENLNDNSPLK